MIRGILLDLAGVLYDGGRAIDGSVRAVARLTDAGVPLRFVTNSTRAPRRKLLQKLQQMGFRIGPDQLSTPASAACAALTASGRRPHLLIHPDLTEDFADLSEGRAGTSVVIGDAAEYFTYDAMNSAFRALTDGADLLALANNRSFRDADGALSIDIGAYVAALEYASGQKATILGKPARGFFEAALASMGVDAAEAVIIGDDAEADVAGALSAGLGRAVLVRTGKYSKGDEARFTPAPSLVADNLAEAVDLLLPEITSQQ
ncbi:TIGR01458 family HAD-type hydrolase [Roseovarius aestuarii]|uniref:Phospholysine phosphohistidine inorganic pyrophosphate phosphatase n=1 Tax=Roseovarius aestuarii TaxID=475083 RepID=A0A1X7BRU5_9RHOB|nr:TIGR01458 family HAD-type hydrolase [Roseovarius aestuarii]SMC12325.1 Arabinose operon protein AraL [Roseovarius aestuarii]